MEHSAHRHELFAFFVNVLLVDFVSEDHDVLCVANADDGLEIGAVHHLACRVAWVDHHDGARRVAIKFAALNDSLQILKVEAPVLLFIQVVGHELTIVESEES